MNSFGILIAYLMLWLGPIQLIWAFFHLLLTRYSSIRKHFARYFLGVLLYFILLFLLLSISEYSDAGIFYEIHFFGGAWTLAFYHVYIVCKSINMVWNKIPADLRQKAPDYVLDDPIAPLPHNQSTTSA